ncbi:MAG: caspase family protein [Deltaproteobacteria bacterium]|nr:caspase family protein [Deltaproteobacteria bacterium]
MGGGYAPNHSEATLEQNVFIFSDLMNQFRPQNSDATYLFGSGPDSQSLDVMEQNPNFSLEDNLFSRLFDNCESPDCQFRHNGLGNLLSGEASKRNILDFLELTKNKLSPSDKFRFYFTGHGKHEDNDFTKNYISTWKKEHISVQEFTEKLDTLPSETQTQVVMVQCFSGGFAQINYEGGDKNKPLSPANRCGFFAQVPDRIAAGCTPDLKKREEYSHYFWDAYRGKTDFNQDGKVTSNEAHAYVIIHENSIDIPTTTSSQLLRDQEFSLSTEKKRTPWTEFQTKLNPTEKAILKGLQEKTGYDIASSPTPLIFVEEKIKHLQEMKELSIQQSRLAQNILDEVFVQIRNELFMIYPIFNNSYGANHGDLLSAQFQIVQNAKQAMLTHPEFSHYQDLFLKRDEANDEVDSWKQLIVKWERIQYLLETKLLEDLLAASSLDTVKQKYKSLKDCESASFF